MACMEMHFLHALVHEFVRIRVIRGRVAPIPIALVSMESGFCTTRRHVPGHLLHRPDSTEQARVGMLMEGDSAWRHLRHRE